MKKNTQLINILKAELTLLSKDILQNIHQDDVKDLYKATRRLYEKMAAVMVLKHHLTAEELTQILSSEKPVKQEEKTEIVIEKTVEKPIEKPKPVTKDDNPYKKMDKISFVRKEPKQETSSASSEKVSNYSQKPLKKMSIGLNDRISFIKHLFKGDADTYTNFIDKLNAFDSYEDALQFINQEIKPLFDNWDGLDEYEFRLLQLLELKFA